MKMIDVSAKKITEREAIAEGEIYLKSEVIGLIKEKKIPKGDVLEAAKIAGIFAAKKTPEIIPLCHPIPIDSAELEFYLERDKIRIVSAIKGSAKTGFEMEALSAVAAAALTIYDMCKPLDKDMEISRIRLIRKTGGKSGAYFRKG